MTSKRARNPGRPRVEMKERLAKKMEAAKEELQSPEPEGRDGRGKREGGCDLRPGGPVGELASDLTESNQPQTPSVAVDCRFSHEPGSIVPAGVTVSRLDECYSGFLLPMALNFLGNTVCHERRTYVAWQAEL